MILTLQRMIFLSLGLRCSFEIILFPFLDCMVSCTSTGDRTNGRQKLYGRNFSDLMNLIKLNSGIKGDFLEDIGLNCIWLSEICIAQNIEKRIVQMFIFTIIILIIKREKKKCRCCAKFTNIKDSMLVIFIRRDLILYLVLFDLLFHKLSDSNLRAYS